MFRRILICVFAAGVVVGAGFVNRTQLTNLARKTECAVTFAVGRLRRAVNGW